MGPPATRRRQARTAQGPHAVGAPAATLLLPRGEAMPCLSWLVHARSRGVRGSGPPGFAGGSMPRTARSLFGSGTAAHLRSMEKCPRAQTMVEVRAMVAAYRDRSPTRLPSARRVGCPRSSTRSCAVRRLTASAEGDLEAAQGYRENGGNCTHVARRRKYVRLTLLFGADRTHAGLAAAGVRFSRAGAGMPGAAAGETQQPLQPG